MVHFATSLTIACCLLTATSRDAHAWGRDGHRIVCRIAWQLLDQARRTGIDRLVAAYRDPDGNGIGTYWTACLFADDARSRANGNPSGPWGRFRPFEVWHYMNVPRSRTLLTAADCPSNCVVTALREHADSLRTGNTDRTKAEGLFFLSHWVGDLHQPLHISYADDRGGNGVQPIGGAFYSAGNMHALWDSDILSKSLGSTAWEAYADALAAAITPAERASWIRSDALSWAQESYSLATRTATQYCDWTMVAGALTCAGRSGGRTFRQDYQAEYGDDVNQRLQQAGVRLAELLRAIMTVP